MGPAGLARVVPSIDDELARPEHAERATHAVPDDAANSHRRCSTALFEQPEEPPDHHRRAGDQGPYRYDRECLSHRRPRRGAVLLALFMQLSLV